MRAYSRLLPLLAMAAMAADAAEGLRNPFWPKGYAGEMTPISADVRPKKPAPKPKADAKAKPKADAKADAAAREAAARKAAAKAAAEAREAAAKAAAAKEAAAKAAAERAAQEAEAERKREISGEDWKNAMKSLKIGNPAVVTTQDGRTRSTVNINGNIYGDGDLMSVTHDGIRFTWRVKGLAGGEKLKLERLRARRTK